MRSPEPISPGNRPRATIQISFPTRLPSVRAPGPKMTPGYRVTTGVPRAIQRSVTWSARYFVRS